MADGSWVGRSGGLHSTIPGRVSRRVVRHGISDWRWGWLAVWLAASVAVYPPKHPSAFIVPLRIGRACDVAIPSNRAAYPLEVRSTLSPRSPTSRALALATFAARLLTQDRVCTAHSPACTNSQLEVAQARGSRARHRPSYRAGPPCPSSLRTRPRTL